MEQLLILWEMACAFESVVFRSFGNQWVSSMSIWSLVRVEELVLESTHKIFGTLSCYIWWGYCRKSAIAVFLKAQEDHQLNWNHCWFIICLIGLVCVPWGLTSSISLLDSQNHFTLVHNPFITLLDFNPNIFFFFNIRSKNCQCATAEVTPNAKNPT